jgi:hypothetical protein
MTTDALPPDDDDDLTVPAPDAPDAPGERARAKGFAELIDKVVAGRTPAAVPAEEQALLEVATALRAAMRPVELGRRGRAPWSSRRWPPRSIAGPGARPGSAPRCR